MFASGITLKLSIGKQKPEAVSRSFIDAIQSVEVRHSDEGRSGFQIVFQIGRLGAKDLKDYQLLKDPLLTPGNRIKLSVTLKAKAELLMDGIITHQQFSPSSEPGASTFTITGEDITVLMDREEAAPQSSSQTGQKEGPEEHPRQDDQGIVTQLLNKYSKYDVKPEVAKPLVGAPSDKRRIPIKQGTDLEKIQQLAQDNGYVFYIEPTSGKNIAYWGPPKKPGSESQKALTLNMGPYTNLNTISFQHNALAPTRVFGQVQDRETNQIRQLSILKSDRPPLSKFPSINNETCVRDMMFHGNKHTLTSAVARAKSITNRSVDNAIAATGEVDTLRYGALLKVRKLVDLRGVGDSYDGSYYVKQVTHKLQKGDYTQSFTITREGLGSTVNRVT